MTEQTEVSEKLFDSTAETRNQGYDFGLPGLFGGAVSASGQQVGNLSQMMIPAFWRGVQLIANDCAKLPIELSKYNTTSQVYEPQIGSPRYRLVHDQTNFRQTAFETWAMMVTDALIWGNGYAWVTRDENTGRINSILPLLPDRTYHYDMYRFAASVTYPNRYTPFYETEIAGNLIYLDESEVIHLRGASWDGSYGMNPAEYLKDSIGLELARIDFQSKFFARGGRKGGILELPATAQKATRDKIKEGFLKSYNTADDAFETVVLREGAKFHQAQGSLQDTQMVEASQQGLVTVANMLGVPASKLGANVNTSYSSLEMEQRNYWQETLSHWCRKIEEQCWLKLLSANERAAGLLRFRTEVDQLLWADGKTLSDIVSQSVMSGVMVRNEARRYLNLPPMPGGNEPLIPSGMVPASQAQAPPAEEPEPPAEEEEDETEDDQARQLIRDDCERRFHKRLKSVVAKAKRNQTIVNWEEQEAAGREIFRGYQALIGVKECIATEIVKGYRDDFTA